MRAPTDVTFRQHVAREAGGLMQRAQMTISADKSAVPETHCFGLQASVPSHKSMASRRINRHEEHLGCPWP